MRPMNVVATDVARQRDDAEAGDRRLFQGIMSSHKSRGVSGMTTSSFALPERRSRQTEQPPCAS